jgi:Zn-dependent M28 family amino/carboxypeptidase
LWRSLIYRRIRLQESGGAPQGWGRFLPGDLWSKIRRTVNRLDSRVVLAGVLLVLLFWSAVFVVWNMRPQGEIATFASSSLAPEAARTELKVLSTPVAVEVTGSEANADGSGQPGPSAVATPVLRPVGYEPGPLAVSGDLLALASEFEAEAAMAQIETLTGPPYLGRYPSSPEGREAADYIAQEFRLYGLQPAGKDGSFFQPFPFDYVALKAEPRLVVAAPDGTVHDDYVLFEDYAALARWYAGSGDAEAQVVWGNQCSRDDFAVARVQDRIVLCSTASVMEAERNAIEHGAAGLLLLTDPAVRPADLGQTYYEPWVPRPIPVLRAYPLLAEDLLRGSNVSLADLSLGLEPFPLETRVSVEVQTEGAEICPARGCQARNVLGVLPGRDPDYAERVIILGAHYDHLGQGPEGTVWSGANDNASGVAVMLEIARTWHEQGYVPRHTVLFAAWDAEEEGLLGSRQYVQAPSYPLGNTVAMIQLDMVGAGGATLWIHGGGELAERLQAAAEALGVEAEITGFGRSDHVPFLEVGVAAGLLIWQFEDGEPRYHRPGDTPETIQLDKLDAVGRIVGTTLLGLTEGEPAIKELLERRAAALASGDLEAFLATSVPGQEPADRLWFSAARGFSPSKITMEATDVRVQGRTATAMVRTTLGIMADGAGRSNGVEDSTLSVRFQQDSDGWRWAGPNLVRADEGPWFSVAGPPGVARSGELEGVGELTARQYAEIAALLGLETGPDASLLVFPTRESLRASTSLALPPGQETWVGPGTVKLTYSAEITASEELTAALTQLLLVEAGVPETATPWLWRGLPLALRARSDPTAWQSWALPELQRTLFVGQTSPTGVMDWAAVDYMRDRVGWLGVGEFIARLGESCREAQCTGSEGADKVFAEHFRTDAAGFEDAWQTDWRERLSRAQTALDAVLEERSAAILAGDEGAFLRTVDPGVPNLLAEEEHWFAEVQKLSFEGFLLAGSPIALLDNGSILAAVVSEYKWMSEATSAPGAGAAQGDKAVTLRVSFTSASDDYRWAGVPLQTLQRGTVQVLHPEGQEGLAEDLLVEADRVQKELASILGLGDLAGPTIKLYDSADAFRSSISPALSLREPWSARSQADASIKIHSPPRATVEELRPVLAAQLARHLLMEMNVDAEWLLSGVSTYLSSRYDGGAGERAAARSLHDLLLAVSNAEFHDLRQMPRPEEVSDQEREVVNAQAWDTVRYLVSSYGWEALADLLERQARGQDLDSALQAATGQSVPEFQAEWALSLSRAHAKPEWIEMALAFDPESASAHVEYLAAPELEGRLAGSPGAETAAAYIATGFEEAGLLPAGDASGIGGQAFFQTVPFTRTVLLSAPLLEVVGGAGRQMISLAYRQDYLVPSSTTVGAGDATGELIWFDDDDYRDTDLAGKIVLRRPARQFDVEVAEAARHGGAGGLILIGDKTSGKELLAKTLLSSGPSKARTIPVLELTQAGFDRLGLLVGSELTGKLDSSPVLPLGLTVRVAIPVSEPEVKETVNVLGLLPGSDPALSQEVLILGAHYDHVGDDPDVLLCSGGEARVGGHVSDIACIRQEGRRFAGANDNASGVGVLLEIARLWHESGYKPQRSVLFAAWGAQEQGEIGSRYYIENPARPLENTVASVVLDRVGGGQGYYLEAHGAGEREDLLLFNLQTVEELVDGRLALKAKSGESDQIPFRNAGVPALLLTWREASDKNWPVELADEVDPYRLGVTSRMVSLTLMSLAR